MKGGSEVGLLKKRKVGVVKGKVKAKEVDPEQGGGAQIETRSKAGG